MMGRSAILHELSAFLTEHRMGIVEQFIAGVRIEPGMPTTDHLDKSDVADHLVELLESLSEELRDFEGNSRSEEVKEYARAHGRARWAQGCQLSEVLREYSILRQVLIFRMFEFEQLQPLFRDSERSRAARTLHGLLDEVMILCASEFLRLTQCKT